MVEAAFRVVCFAGVMKKKEGLVIMGRRRCFEAIENLSNKLCYLSIVWHFHCQDIEIIANFFPVAFRSSCNLPG